MWLVRRARSIAQAQRARWPDAGFRLFLLSKELIPPVFNIGRETNIQIEQLVQQKINLLELCLAFLCRQACESQCCDPPIKLFQGLSQGSFS
jgi:hypothetical protein